MMNLEQLGWNAHFDKHCKPFRQQALVAARVVRAGGGFYSLLNADGEQTATLTGQLRHASSADTLPVVGDWVAIDTPEDDGIRIHAVLPRQTALKRAAVGNRKGQAEKPGVPQVLAANVNTAIIVSGLDNDYNPRRIERFLTLVYESGAAPIIILNKADLCPETKARRTEVEALAFGIPVLVTCALRGEGLDDLAPHLQAGRTLVLLGSSGAGKSTLLNRIAGADYQRTAEVSAAVGKGTHTTTHRELFPLPGGALVIDTPGLRELHLWGESEEGLASTFPEIVTLARQCRFSDCQHEKEPGCAIRQALLEEALDPPRLESYLKQREELVYAAHRQGLATQVAQKQKSKVTQRKRWRPGDEDDQ
ncbi:MAG: ribosome small subunit-dependent GTPase A [Desulfuromonadales bacterium]|nr:ribosome small subunit-dependent GTPase A [Desulfuromonadales bacterium]